jgi:choline dehydrogenase
VQTAVHPSGGFTMGTDTMAVVNPTMRVNGIAGLRVADSSIMSIIPSGNLNGPTIMVAECAADLVKVG